MEDIMSVTTQTASDVDVPLAEVEQELARQYSESASGDDVPVMRTRLSNLVIFCNQCAQTEMLTQVIPQIVAVHPARVLLLIGEPGEELPLRAHLNVQCELDGNAKLCTEQVTLRAGGQHINQLPFALRELLIGDLPTNLWWVPQTPPALAGHFLHDLAEHAQQIIYDSIGWFEPARGVAATSAWLAHVHRTSGGQWRVAADLNWRRLKHWRRVLAQALDPNTAPGAIESITELLVEHGPHAVIQAWELVSWLASRLGWKVQLGNFEPGVEITWQVVAPHGSLRVRIRRLSEGPSEIRKVRIHCAGYEGADGMSIAVDNQQRLAVVLEGRDTAPRTVMVQPSSEAQLVANQLSNRDSDPVFLESMAVAEVFARTVLQ
jgi:glucose-6-phosphate dehydrogenase assembly protein OpcA